MKKMANVRKQADIYSFISSKIRKDVNFNDFCNEMRKINEELNDYNISLKEIEYRLFGVDCDVEGSLEKGSSLYRQLATGNSKAYFSLCFKVRKSL